MIDYDIEKDYLCFIDESGDHSLESVNKDFPVFVLAAVFVPTNDYYSDICSGVNAFKYAYFGHEGVILHSRDIRKAIEPFNILINKDVRVGFLTDLSGLLRGLNFEVVICVIDKQKHIEKYGVTAENPYKYAVKVILERLVHPIQKRGIKRVNIIAESRGNNEDRDLELEILRILRNGTEFRSSNDFNPFCNPTFVKKENNVIGLQIADLMAYPAGRYVINSDGPNRAFEIVCEKFLGGSQRYNFVILP